MKLFKLHGIIIDSEKNTENSETITLPLPEYVTIPVESNGKILVKAGDEVKTGQKIAEEGDDNFPVYSSVSGKVDGVEQFNCCSENFTNIKIITDGRQTVYENINPPKVFDRQSLVNALKNSACKEPYSGIHTYRKFDYPDDKEIDTLIINGCENEPVVTSRYRCMIEDTYKILGCAKLLKELLNVKNVFICINSNYYDAVKLLKEKSVDIEDENIVVKKSDSTYPAGNEKILVYNTLGRKISSDATDEGVVVIDALSAAFIYDYINTGMPKVSVHITVDGDVLKTPCNVLVPVGTSVKNLLDFADTNYEFLHRVVKGNPLNGRCMENISVPVFSQDCSLLAYKKPLEIGKGQLKEAVESTNCIKCGRCHEGCPIGLRPDLIEKAYDKNNVNKLIRLNVNLCFECGGCTYICPARRNLSEKISLAKKLTADSKKGE